MEPEPESNSTDGRESAGTDATSDEWSSSAVDRAGHSSSGDRDPGVDGAHTALPTESGTQPEPPSSPFVDGVDQAQAMGDWPAEAKGFGRLLSVFSLLLLLVLLVGWPLWAVVDASLPKSTPMGQALARMQEPGWLLQQVQINLVSGLASLWVFVIGASLGSFLNVAVYRLPLGRSIGIARSFCPRCGSAIRLSDNLPLLGWMRLKGRCRNCHAPIATRYPGVELVCGLVLLFLFLVELSTGGRNLPVRDTNAYSGVVWTLLYPKPDLIGLFLFHSALLLALVVWGLFRIDRTLPPAIYRLASSAGFVLAPLLAGSLCLVCWRPGLNSPFDYVHRPFVENATSVLLGGMAGALLSWLLALITRTKGDRWAGAETLWPLLWIGVCLGWQALLAIVAVAMVIDPWLPRGRFLTDGSTPVGRLPFAASLLVVALLHQALWRWTASWGFPWFPGPSTDWVHALPALFLTLLLALVAGVRKQAQTLVLQDSDPWPDARPVDQDLTVVDLRSRES